MDVRALLRTAIEETKLSLGQSAHLDQQREAKLEPIRNTPPNQIAELFKARKNVDSGQLDELWSKLEQELSREDKKKILTELQQHDQRFPKKFYSFITKSSTHNKESLIDDFISSLKQKELEAVILINFDGENNSIISNYENILYIAKLLIDKPYLEKLQSSIQERFDNAEVQSESAYYYGHLLLGIKSQDPQSDLDTKTLKNLSDKFLFYTDITNYNHKLHNYSALVKFFWDELIKHDSDDDRNTFLDESHISPLVNLFFLSLSNQDRIEFLESLYNTELDPIFQSLFLEQLGKKLNPENINSFLNSLETYQDLNKFLIDLLVKKHSPNNSQLIIDHIPFLPELLEKANENGYMILNLYPSTLSDMIESLEQDQEEIRAKNIVYCLVKSPEHLKTIYKDRVTYAKAIEILESLSS